MEVVAGIFVVSIMKLRIWRMKTFVETPEAKMSESVL